MRSYGDLDLLVRRRDIRRATELMIASGYQPAVPLRPSTPGNFPASIFFSKPDSRFHRTSQRLSLRYFPRRLPLERFFERQIRVQLDSRRGACAIRGR